MRELLRLQADDRDRIRQLEWHRFWLAFAAILGWAAALVLALRGDGM